MPVDYVNSSNDTAYPELTRVPEEVQKRPAFYGSPLFSKFGNVMAKIPTTPAPDWRTLKKKQQQPQLEEAEALNEQASNGSSQTPVHRTARKRKTRLPKQLLEWQDSQKDEFPPAEPSFDQATAPSRDENFDAVDLPSEPEDFESDNIAQEESGVTLSLAGNDFQQEEETLIDPKQHLGLAVQDDAQTDVVPMPSADQEHINAPTPGNWIMPVSQGHSSALVAQQNRNRDITQTIAQQLDAVLASVNLRRGVNIKFLKQLDQLLQRRASEIEAKFQNQWSSYTPWDSGGELAEIREAARYWSYYQQMRITLQGLQTNHEQLNAMLSAITADGVFNHPGHASEAMIAYTLQQLGCTASDDGTFDVAQVRRAILRSVLAPMVFHRNSYVACFVNSVCGNNPIQIVDWLVQLVQHGYIAVGDQRSTWNGDEISRLFQVLNQQQVSNPLILVLEFAFSSMNPSDAQYPFQFLSALGPVRFQEIPFATIFSSQGTLNGVQLPDPYAMLRFSLVACLTEVLNNYLYTSRALQDANASAIPHIGTTHSLDRVFVATTGIRNGGRGWILSIPQSLQTAFQQKLTDSSNFAMEEVWSILNQQPEISVIGNLSGVIGNEDILFIPDNKTSFGPADYGAASAQSLLSTFGEADEWEHLKFVIALPEPYVMWPAGNLSLLQHIESSQSLAQKAFGVVAGAYQTLQGIQDQAQWFFETGDALLSAARGGYYRVKKITEAWNGPGSMVEKFMKIAQEGLNPWTQVGPENLQTANKNSTKPSRWQRFTQKFKRTPAAAPKDEKTFIDKLDQAESGLKGVRNLFNAVGLTVEKGETAEVQATKPLFILKNGIGDVVDAMKVAGIGTSTPVSSAQPALTYTPRKMLTYDSQAGNEKGIWNTAQNVATNATRGLMALGTLAQSKNLQKIGSAGQQGVQMWNNLKTLTQTPAEDTSMLQNAKNKASAVYGLGKSVFGGHGVSGAANAASAGLGAKKGFDKFNNAQSDVYDRAAAVGQMADSASRLLNQWTGASDVEKQQAEQLNAQSAPNETPRWNPVRRWLRGKSAAPKVEEQVPPSDVQYEQPKQSRSWNIFKRQQKDGPETLIKEPVKAPEIQEEPQSSGSRLKNFFEWDHASSETSQIEEPAKGVQYEKEPIGSRFRNFFRRNAKVS